MREGITRAKYVALVIWMVAMVGAVTNNAVLENGFEVIYLDYPSWITNLEFAWASQSFFVFGGQQFRQILHSSNFSAIDNGTLYSYDQPFADVSTFNVANSTDLYAVGPSYADSVFSPVGFFLPLVVVGPNGFHKSELDQQKFGYVMSAVSIDSRDPNNLVTYFAGWGPSENGNPAVDFILIRTRFSVTNFTGIDWDNTTDTVFLEQNGYRPYCPTFRPSIYHDWNTSSVYVYSPERRALYKIAADANGTAPLVKMDKYDLSGYGESASVDFYWNNNTLFFGFVGTPPLDGGVLIEFDLKSFSVSRKITFPAGYTNPRAITGRSTVLYVGFLGGPAIVAIDLIQWKILGFAGLPGHLHNVYSAWDERSDFVYFATYEQNSKVFRLAKTNFCSAVCSNDGSSICVNAACVCADPYVRQKDGTCGLNPSVKTLTVTIKEEAAAIVMGVLFAIMTIVAGAGWFMWWRNKKGGYQQVLKG